MLNGCAAEVDVAAGGWRVSAGADGSAGLMRHAVLVVKVRRLDGVEDATFLANRERGDL